MAAKIIKHLYFDGAKFIRQSARPNSFQLMRTLIGLLNDEGITVHSACWNSLTFGARTRPDHAMRIMGGDFNSTLSPLCELINTSLTFTTFIEWAAQRSTLWPNKMGSLAEHMQRARLWIEMCAEMSQKYEKIPLVSLFARFLVKTN